jgi:hypothetical protein
VNILGVRDSGEPMPGVIAVHQRLPIGDVVDDLLLVASCSLPTTAPEDLRGPLALEGAALHGEAASGAVPSSVAWLGPGLGTMSGRHFAEGASTPKSNSAALPT